MSDEEKVKQEDFEDQSPDFLGDPAKGRGVRRLNRRPLMIAGGIGVLVLAVIGYSFTTPQASQKAAEDKDANASIDFKSAPPIQPSEEELNPKPPEMPETPAIPSGSKDDSGDSKVASDGSGKASIFTDAEIRQMIREQYLAAKKAAEKREELAAAAQNASTGVGEVKDLKSVYKSMESTAAPVDKGTAYSDYVASVNNAPADDGGMAGSNRQAQKNAFLEKSLSSGDNYLHAARTAQLAPSQEVKAGTIIPGVMISGLNSDLPGQIIAQVRENVYDTATGDHLLIPSGSRLVGSYDSAVTLGQERALVGWRRIIFPNGDSIDIANMPGSDVSGYAGFKDKVNNHYWRTFGNGILLSLFSAGTQLSQPKSSGDDETSSQTIAAAMGQQLGQLGMQIASRNLNIQPTIEIRPGYQFNIMVTKDIVLPNWEN